MTDEEIIRKAVELANHFKPWETFDGAFAFTLYLNDDPDGLEFVSFYVDDENRQELAWGLDLLAAQLVRQVDARGGCTALSYPACATVYEHGDGRKWVTGTDRTMNTLRAIVESRVLEGQE